MPISFGDDFHKFLGESPVKSTTSGRNNNPPASLREISLLNWCKSPRGDRFEIDFECNVPNANFVWLWRTWRQPKTLVLNWDWSQSSWRLIEIEIFSAQVQCLTHILKQEFTQFASARTAQLFTSTLKRFYQDESVCSHVGDHVFHQVPLLEFFFDRWQLIISPVFTKSLLKFDAPSILVQD